ncbi:MAG: hypothetical protein BWY91_02153 [bacterium ADurb.BinA028]|nr:MAG: hypothetical protein BWY91_02153 [bacterium ADurb.BinA028]
MPPESMIGATEAMASCDRRAWVAAAKKAGPAPAVIGVKPSVRASSRTWTRSPSAACNSPRNSSHLPGR